LASLVSAAGSPTPIRCFLNAEDLDILVDDGATGGDREARRDFP
jgi:hypothetical protein